MKIMFDLGALAKPKRLRLQNSLTKMGIATVEQPPPKRRRRAGAGTPTAADKQTTTISNPKNKAPTPSRQAEIAFDFLAPNRRGAK